MNPLQTTAGEIVARGAILTVWNSPPHHHLVGEWEWDEPDHIFWFTAHGDRVEDGHRLRFDAMRQVGPECIEFVYQGVLVARLASIVAAEVEDRDDFAIAHSIWKQVQPCVRPLIERSRARFDP